MEGKSRSHGRRHLREGRHGERAGVFSDTLGKETQIQNGILCNIFMDARIVKSLPSTPD